ncbi:hypothetical protein D9613_003480 [Agrocybe pediades]|uniref:Senescence domain-containing protein n=1 Tax=Agrocybe pediades TaxID=84607 RepID=A0A8H4QP06_9AGAR|nr:hypothetical protein D9613_003480 [Agrocybe pediades]
MTPEAYLLLSLPDASLTTGGGGYPETGVLNLECVSMPSPDSKNEQDKNVYLVLRINSTEVPIDPARVVRRFDEPGRRVYSFAGTQIDPSEMVLAIATPSSKGELTDKIDAFDNILEQYVTEFHGPLHDSNTIAGQSTTVDIKQADSKRDLRGQLVMVNEDTGEVVGQVEDRFRIEEDPVMHQPGHENDPVIIEVGEEYSTRQSDKDALTAFARIVPPEQRNWITSSANIASHAISMTTNLILTTITTASSFYISHSTPSPHASGTSTPTGTRSTTPGAPGAPPPLPPRALVFLTSDKTKKNLNTIHAYSGEAVKISSKTVGMIDKMIRRAIGAGPKRQKYFPTRKDGAGQESGSTLTAPGPALPAKSRSPSPHPSPPPYSYSSEKQQGEKPPLPPRNLGNTNAAAGSSTSSQPPPLPPRLTTKDHLLISADLILSTIDDSTRRLLDTGTEQVGRIVGHKYGPEAAQSSLLMAGTARNVGLVYVDMSGIGRRALLKRAGKNFVKARVKNMMGLNAAQPVPTPKSAQ